MEHLGKALHIGLFLTFGLIVKAYTSYQALRQKDSQIVKPTPRPGLIAPQ